MSQFSVGQVVAVVSSPRSGHLEYKAIVTRLTPTQVIVVRAEDYEDRDNKNKETRFRAKGVDVPRSVGGWNYLLPWSDKFEYKHFSRVLADRLRRCNRALAQAALKENYEAVAKYSVLFLEYKKNYENKPTFEQWIAERKK